MYFNFIYNKELIISKGVSDGKKITSRTVLIIICMPLFYTYSLSVSTTIVWITVLIFLLLPQLYSQVECVM